MKRTCKILLGR